MEDSVQNNLEDCVQNKQRSGRFFLKPIIIK
jgi:hypothetical protein